MWVCQQARKFLVWVIQVMHVLNLKCAFLVTRNRDTLLSPTSVKGLRAVSM